MTYGFVGIFDVNWNGCDSESWTECAELAIRSGIATLLYTATGGGVGCREDVVECPTGDVVVTKLDEAGGLTTVEIEVEIEIEVDGDDNAAMAAAVQAELAALSNEQLAAAVGAATVTSTSAPLVVEAR